MIEIGKIQTLTIIKKAEFGVYLKDTLDKNDQTEVLLPKKEVPEYSDIMDPIEVFIYKDSQDRLIATTTVPYITLGQVASLKVKDVNKVGAFLDWNLPKDLLLPFKEQKGGPQAGETVTVSLYVDKSGRLCATQWVSDEKKKESAYEAGADRLLRILKKNGRFLPIGDKSTPDEIKEYTGMSKNEFKRSAGNLYKRKMVEITDSSIKLK